MNEMRFVLVFEAIQIWSIAVLLFALEFTM